ncbi:hypothetical protein GCM10011297_08900 [Bacterioplanes sanyensis]|uniref:hypothetical protein n=1 Tax=Bacterioplanes sanyensis TaxID=1249553 RepID=UPI00167B6581|nr:hypothetical protein [Bacterioplanes sanyensis]GGY37979.1 hypothetical protein GCM10011297_08900 [Bacterioplanes sanyensis]
MATTQTAQLNEQSAPHPATSVKGGARLTTGYFDVLAGLALAQKRERQRQRDSE